MSAGFKEDSGLCNTNAIARPRNARSSRSREPEQVSAFIEIGLRRRSGTRFAIEQARGMAMASVLLPGATLADQAEHLAAADVANWTSRGTCRLVAVADGEVRRQLEVYRLLSVPRSWRLVLLAIPRS